MSGYLIISFSGNSQHIFISSEKLLLLGMRLRERERGGGIARRNSKGEGNEWEGVERAINGIPPPDVI